MHIEFSINVTQAKYRKYCICIQYMKLYVFCMEKTIDVKLNHLYDGILHVVNRSSSSSSSSSSLPSSNSSSSSSTSSSYDPYDLYMNRRNFVEWIQRDYKSYSFGIRIIDPRSDEILKGYVRNESLRMRQDALIFIRSF